jgi:hypothetical protein
MPPDRLAKPPAVPPAWMEHVNCTDGAVIAVVLVVRRWSSAGSSPTPAGDNRRVSYRS